MKYSSVILNTYFLCGLFHDYANGIQIQSYGITTLYFILFIHICSTCFEMETAVAQWLRYCVTIRKVAGSIPDDVTGIFH
jgi:hypothetical protein